MIYALILLMFTHPLILQSIRNFFENLHNFFIPNSFKFVGRYFNCIESDLDKFYDFYSFAHFACDPCLVDVWQKKHDHKVSCTWFNSDKSIGTRLDKFFIPQDLLDHTFSSEIIPCVFRIMMWCSGS